MRPMMMFRIAAVLFGMFLWTAAVAQSTIPPLEREVSIKATNETVSSLMSSIASQANVKFSYNPAVVAVTKKISVSFYRKPVRTVLASILDEQVQYRQRGNFIILTAKPGKSTTAVKHITISGYVYNDRGDKLASASILNRNEHLAAVTDRYGYFTMQVEAQKFPVSLKVEKENFADTSLKIEPGQKNVDVVLAVPQKEALPVQVIPSGNIEADASGMADTATIVSPGKKHFFGQSFLSEETKANLRNLTDTLFSDVQISLIPYFSTNKLLVGNTVNDVSLNILAGYSQGVNMAEFGGLINIDRKNVQYLQVAGLFNAVGGDVKGVQLAGWANATAGSMKGFRAAGFVNAGHHMDGVQVAGLMNLNADYVTGYRSGGIKYFVLDTVRGFQAAGLMNLNAGYAKGVRLAGLCNAGNNLSGSQVAGLVNGNLGYMHGAQVAGLMNVTKGYAKGFSLAGLVNVNFGHTRGMHIAGLTNLAYADVEGMQIAPVLNVAGKLNGSQVGLVNFSDSCSGAAFGLISFVVHGYHKIELFGDEVLYTQLAFRTGVPRFHNIFLAGVDLTTRIDGLWSFGYGFGSLLRLSKKWKLEGDLVSQLLLKRSDITNAPQLSSLFIGVERSIGKRFSIAAGPAYRFMITRNAAQNGPEIANRLVPYSFYDHTTDGGTNLKMWVGGKLSLKFL